LTNKLRIKEECLNGIRKHILTENLIIFLYLTIMKANEIIFLVEESLEGGYEAKAIGESIFTEAESIDELKSNIKEAVHCHFDNPNYSYKVVFHS